MLLTSLNCLLLRAPGRILTAAPACRARCCSSTDDRPAVDPDDRAVQWNLMKDNFGTRWEGETRWFSPGGETSLLSPTSDPLPSVYQLEFPTTTPELGTWRGWGVLAPGDTRVVALSEATVVERQPGSSTFQFAGVGGRSTLRTDGTIWAAEVNFFHADRRCGLVLYYKPPVGGIGSTAAFSLMSMSFRAAPISDDGNLTFVSTPEITRTTAHTLTECDEENDAAHKFARPGTCVRREEMGRSYRLRPQPLPNVVGLVDWDRVGSDPACLEASMPDGVRLRVPRVVESDATFAFGCDFRPIGGPFRSLVIECSGFETQRWVCTEHV